MKQGEVTSKLKLSLIDRLMLGGIFIFSGLNKIINPESFGRTLHVFNFLSNSFIGFIASIYPWLLLVLGILLISGYLVKYVAPSTSILLLIFIIMDILGASEGGCQACGFLFDSIFYKRGNPFVFLTINYLLLGLSATILMSKKVSPDKTPFSFSKKVVFPLSIFFVVFLGLILITFSMRRSYDAKFVSAASEKRSLFMEELKDLPLIGADIKTISNIEFPINPDIRIIVILTLKSLDCGNCAAEASYLEYLNVKYGRKIFFCGVVPKIGKTAADNFRRKYSISYPLIEDSAIFKFKIFSKYNSLMIIISQGGKILKIDPISLGVKKFQDEYEEVLLSYLK